VHKNLLINVVNLSIVYHIKLLYTTRTIQETKMFITNMMFCR